jgi:hypothetical protein
MVLGVRLRPDAGRASLSHHILGPLGNWDQLTIQTSPGRGVETRTPTRTRIRTRRRRRAASANRVLGGRHGHVRVIVRSVSDRDRHQRRTSMQLLLEAEGPPGLGARARMQIWWGTRNQGPGRTANVAESRQRKGAGSLHGVHLEL